jgi:trehalose 6-phosphate phosphatase
MLRDASLMLDFDGTLIGLFDRPDAVVVDPPLTRLLERLVDTLSGRVAIVTGRSLAQIEKLLGPVASDLALCGSHGAELRLGGVTERPERPVALDEVATSFRAFAEDKPGMIVEIKTRPSTRRRRKRWPTDWHATSASRSSTAR